MQKIIVASDSFKGCLSSLEVATAVEEGIKRICPACAVIKIPMADGGEGLTDVLLYAKGGRRVSLEVHDPCMHKISATYGILSDGQTAVIELAAASGLPLLLPAQRNPLQTTTLGTGELIADALQRGCHYILLGIGGSATNDAGTGLLHALGFRFLSASGKILEGKGICLEQMEKIDLTNVMPQVKGARFQVACDVDNPFYGKEGAAYVFGPQKGASLPQVRQLDKGLRHFAGTIKKITGVSIHKLPGAGAAGGTGGGLKVLLNAELIPGVEMILDSLQFDELLDKADLVITGEGRIDRQTLRGKVPFGVARRAHRAGVPVIVIGGKIEDREELEKAGLTACYAVTPDDMSLETALLPDVARKNIRNTIAKIVKPYVGF